MVKGPHGEQTIQEHFAQNPEKVAQVRDAVEKGRVK